MTDHHDGSPPINPEIEEDGREYLEEMLREDEEFQRAWTENSSRRWLAARMLGFRLDRGLSEAALAEKIGTNEERVRLLENADADPSSEELHRLTEVFLDFGEGSAKASRESVVHKMLTARTLQEVEQAEIAAQEWIRDHPEDDCYISEAGESLMMVRLALREQRGENE